MSAQVDQHALATTAGPWCRACGSGTPAGATKCPGCNWPLDAADPGPAEVGLVVKVGGGLRSRWGVTVDVTADHVSVTVKDGETIAVSAADLAGLDRKEHPGSDLPSAAGRLFAVHRATERGDLKARWEPERPRQAGIAMATTTVGLRRGSIQDCLALDLDDVVATLQLADSEVAWHRAVSAARRDDVEELVRALEALPPQGYALRLSLVQRAAPKLVGDEALARRVATSLALVTDPAVQPRASALACALAGGDFPARRSAASVLADILLDVQPASGAPARRAAEALARGEVIDPGPAAGLPVMRAVALWAAGRAGHSLDGHADALLPLPQTMLDDLIDAGALTAAASRSSLALGADRTYLRARMAPAALSIEETHQLGFAAEYARRLYKVGDLERLTQFPPGHPDADHYIALLNLRRNPAKSTRDGLRPEAVKVLEQIDDYIARLADGTRELPPEEVLADPSTWRMLRASADKGHISLDPEQRAAHPQFADWVDLVELQRLVFEGRLDEVRRRGAELADRYGEGPLRTEALNMAAYAELDRGNAGEALRLLERAMQGGSFTNELVVNAAVVAAELGADRAATFLAHIFDTSPDPEVGVRALLKGVGVWLADDASTRFPEPISRSIRAAVGRPLDDDTLLLFLRVACDHDREWLANTAAPHHSDGQQDIVRYWTTRARALTPGTGVVADDLAGLLAELKARPEPARWVDAELESFIAMIDDGIHVTFGEGAWTSGPIKVLANANLLDPPREVIFLCQAGAHLAASFETEDSCLNPGAEGTYLFEPLERWRVAKADLPKRLVEAVDEEVNACFFIAAVSMYLFIGRRVDEFSREWASLVERERWDVQNRPVIERLEREALEGAASWVERLAPYESRVNVRLLNDERRSLWNDLQSNLDRWRREITRLRALL